MKYVKLQSATVNGLKIETLSIEVSILKGLPRFESSGLPAQKGQEIFSRVRAALLNNGFAIPRSRIVCHISPELRQIQDNSLDLAIAIAVLIADRQIAVINPDNLFLAGKLNLSGAIDGIKGLYAMRQIADLKKLIWIIPAVNSAELQFEHDLSQVYQVCELNQAVDVITQNNVNLYACCQNSELPPAEPLPDLQPIIAQPLAMRALEIAIAGWHPLLLIGSPGCGKSSLAELAKYLLPATDNQTAKELRELFSIKGDFNEVISPNFRPFEAPHYSINPQNFIGGGSQLSPGVITLAHQGILYLDELSEFKSSTLQLLRKPLTDKYIELRNHQQTQIYPANFLLIASMNPCPCGYYFEEDGRCQCKPAEIMKYKKKITGALFDRFQLSVIMLNLKSDDLLKTASNQNIKEEEIRKIKDRIENAREMQRKRCKLNNMAFAENADIKTEKLADFFLISNRLLREFNRLTENYLLSPRSFLSLLRVARTIADLADEATMKKDYLQEAFMLRVKTEIY